MGVLAIDGAADRLGSTKDLLDGAGHLAGHGATAHGLGDLDDLLEGDVAGVLDVLLLLAVTGGLAESADDKGRRRGDDGDLGSAVFCV